MKHLPTLDCCSLSKGSIPLTFKTSAIAILSPCLLEQKKKNTKRKIRKENLFRKIRKEKYEKKYT